MTPDGPAFQHRRLRAPKEDGATYIDPPLSQAGQLIEANRRSRGEQPCEILGRPLAALADEARRQLIDAAAGYTRSYRDVDVAAGAADRPVLIAGHQPQMFHPGVWLKSFALSRLAEQHQGTAINLIIDNDTLRHPSLRVPGGSIARPTVSDVMADQPNAEMPYEQRRIVDRELFLSFGRRASDQIAPLVPEPLLKAFWPMVLDRFVQTDNLGECIAQGRHRLEGEWGLSTLEIPLSRVCRLEAFEVFVAHLLARLADFHEVYNSSLAEYRRINHVRSRAHPVPDLAAQDDWLEAPLWIWSDEDPQRRRLFVRRDGDAVVLSDRRHREIRLTIARDCTNAAAAAQLTQLANSGLKLRPRALLTTMFARLFLSDLFLHGIGGAKYDQLTDVLIARFFGVRPPRFLTLSGTLLLPIDRPAVDAGLVRDTSGTLRELKFHPEVHLPASHVDSTTTDLIAAKQRWIETPQTPANARERYLAFRSINAALQPAVAQIRRRLLGRLETQREMLRTEAILTSREYAFCLYDEKTLRKLIRIIGGRLTSNVRR